MVWFATASVQGHRVMVRTMRRVGTILALAWVASLFFAGPAFADRKPNRGGQDVVTTTRNYLTTFYPIWFTHSQFAVAPKNELIGPDRISPLYQGVVAINDDTLYASSPIDVSGNGVVRLFVPQTEAGYSVLLLDPYGNVYPSPIPSKPAGVILPPTTYALVSADYPCSDVPGAFTARLPLDFMILIFRADKFSNGVDQTAAATSFRAALAINDVPTNVLPVREYAFPVKTIADGLIRIDPIEFLRMTQVAVRDTRSTPPLSPQERKLSDDFDALFGDGSNLGQQVRAQFSTGARTAHEAIVSNYLARTIANNWVHFTNIGEWKGAVLDRASITEFCQFCNTIDTAAYYHAFVDGTGAALDGSNPEGYVLTFPPGDAPEASRFWSLTAYTPEAIQPIPNPIDKYVVASYTPGLVSDSDGSISIYISRTQPAGVAEANWLPVSDRRFNIMLRVYGVVSKSDVARNKYAPPPIVRR